MTGILEMFLELDGSDRYEMQLELWAVRQQLADERERTASAERVKAWRRRNPERARASQRERNRRWRAAHAKPRQQKPRADRKAYQRAYYEANHERLKAARAQRSVRPTGCDASPQT